MLYQHFQQQKMTNARWKWMRMKGCCDVRKMCSAIIWLHHLLRHSTRTLSTDTRTMFPELRDIQPFDKSQYGYQDKYFLIILQWTTWKQILFERRYYIIDRLCFEWRGDYMKHTETMYFLGSQKIMILFLLKKILYVLEYELLYVSYHIETYKNCIND